MKKTFLMALATVIIFSSFTPRAHADLISIATGPFVSGVMSALGLDKDEVTNLVHTLNVSRRKQQAPQVSLDFSPGNPTEGQKVTAAAKPIYFLNDLSRLYYTWYLQHKNCVKAKKGDSDYDKACDLDEDDDVDIEDWKIEAARIIASNDFDWAKASYSSDTDDDGYQAYLGGDDQQGKDPDPKSHCYIRDFKTGNDFNIPKSKCKHLFPNAPDEKTGDDSFSKDEEKFWRTDPQNPDTANTGNMDEANVAGLGVEEFTWNYQNDDKVGVAVEGISMDPTQDPDASYKIMWAILKNDLCDSVTDSLSKTKTSLTGLTNGTTTVVSAPVVTTDPVTGYVTTVEVTTETTTVLNLSAATATVTTVTTTTTTVVDGLGGPISGPTTTTATAIRTVSSTVGSDNLNDCLEDNLVSPTEGGESQKIDVSLSYFPTSLINDPTGENGTEIVVNSSITNANDPNILKYTWEVYKGDEINPANGWGSPLLKSDLPGIGQTIGAGLTSLKFKPQFKNRAPKFLKVKLSVTESSSGNTGREGHSDVIIPLSLTSNKISVFPVTVSPALVLDLGQAEHCATGIDKAFCPVMQNEIVGMSVAKESYTNFAWTVNGEPVKALNYPNGGSCLSKECVPATSASTNIAYFPVLKEKGTKYDVSLTASNADGEKITLTKNFEVVDPEVKIISSNTSCQPVLLGNYLDLDGKQWPDYSDKNFQAAPSSTISLQPTLNNSFTQDLVWYIDGVALTDENMPYFGAAVSSDKTLTFPAAKQLGEIYNISAKALYSQDNSTKKFLNLNEGVQMGEFFESTISDSIEIQMANLTGASSASASVPRKFLAAIFTGLPAYVSFLFRIVLTVMLILAVSWITMGLTPGTREK